jgi:hypothetical protein
MSKKTRPTINPTDRRTVAARQWLAAKAAADAAAAALADARETLLRVCPDEGLLIIDDGKIAIDVSERRTFDVDVLAQLLDDEKFEAVTKLSVDTKSFDALINRDELPDVSDAVSVSLVTSVKEV